MYEKGIIYLIEHNEKPEFNYLGSTCNLIRRRACHKHSCNTPTSKLYNSKLYRMIRDNGGWDAFTMKPIEEYPCESKTALQIREEYWRKEYNASMNTNSCYTEFKGNDYSNNYRIKHKEPIKIYQTKYREANKELMKLYQSEYRDINREERNSKQNEKVTCDCGKIVSRSGLTRHQTTNKHINQMNLMNASQVELSQP